MNNIESKAGDCPLDAKAWDERYYEAWPQEIPPPYEADDEDDEAPDE